MNKKTDFITTKYLEVIQPIGKFYVVVMNCSDLIDIAKYDIRRIEREEQSSLDNYFGIQRKPSPNRLTEIAQYVTFSDATFPNNIVIAIDSVESTDDKNDIENVKIENGNLHIRRDEKIAQIIDGQHRLLGLQKAFDEGGFFVSEIEEFELIVTIYIDMDIENQSMVFATINKAQTKVNKSLVYDLYDLANSRSPYRTAHNIVRLLNERNDSPFKDKIKMLGVADDTKNETVTQATIVESIVKYISNNPSKDRDILMKGEDIEIFPKDEKRLFFRKWFKEKEDAKIAKTILNYFNAIEDKWKTAWDNNSILVKSTGVIAFMRFLAPIVREYSLEKPISEQTFNSILKPINLNDNSFNNDNYPSGGIGQSKLYKELMEQSDLI